MYLSSEIRIRSKMIARSYVVFRLWVFIAATIITFIIPYLGDRVVMMFQPDWELMLMNYNIGEAYRFLGLSLVMSLVLFVFNSPLLLGMFAWMSEQTLGRKTGLRYIFSWCTPFRRIGKAIAAALTFLLHASLEVLKFCALPIVGLVYLSAVSGSVGANGYAAFLMILLVSLIFGAAFAVARAFAWFPALYLLSVVPDMPISEAFSQCRDFMYVGRAEFHKLVFGFIPWYILENLTFGIAGLFVKPYFYFSMLLFVQQTYNKWLFETGKVPEYVDPLVNMFDKEEDDV